MVITKQKILFIRVAEFLRHFSLLYEHLGLHPCREGLLEEFGSENMMIRMGIWWRKRVCSSGKYKNWNPERKLKRC